MAGIFGRYGLRGGMAAFDTFCAHKVTQRTTMLVFLDEVQAEVRGTTPNWKKAIAGVKKAGPELSKMDSEVSKLTPGEIVMLTSD